jgi:tRNA A-37 threonylcarbamoyl transferase component Bud32
MTTNAADWNGLTLAGGRYKITAKLGEGGMGSVYRALDQNIDAEVVIKVPRQAMMEDPDFAGRFTREIRSLVKLSHPHIVKVTDVGTFEGTPFAVMQFLPGGTLDERRPVGRDGFPLPADPKPIARWLTAVADALDYVHTQGYVHRDVKPGNILFDAEGHGFLSDFGVAKVLASSPEARKTQTAMTGAGMVLGTPEYMAPELIMGEQFDGRVDQYALAVTVYEVLCGRRPFESDAKTKLLVLHTSTAPPPLTKWCPALPGGLSQAVLMGLAKDPNERYRTCAALAAAIVAEAQNAAAPTDFRVRLKCTACGSAGSMAAPDFARVQELGKPMACPACKSPMEAIGSDTRRPSPAPGSGVTNTSATPGSGGQRAQPREEAKVAGGTAALRPPTPAVLPPAPRPVRGQTLAQHIPESPAPKPGPTDPATAAGRRRSRTMIERTGPDPHAEPSSGGIKIPVSPEPERARVKRESGRSRAAPGITVPAWAAVGAGGLGMAAVLSFVFLAMSSSSRKGTEPRTPPSTIAPAASTSQAAPNPPHANAPPRAVAPEQGHAATPLGPAAGSKPPVELSVAERRTRTGRSEPAEEARPAGPANKESPSSTRPPAARPPAAVASNERKPAPFPEPTRFKFGASARNPVRVKVTLEKILSAPEAHANKVVIPIGMFELARSRDDRPDGPRKYAVTELRCESRGR